MIFGMGVGALSILAVLGFVVTVLGGLAALYLKDAIDVRVAGPRVSRHALEEVRNRYRTSIFLAAQELGDRLYSLSRDDRDPAERLAGYELLRADFVREPQAATGPHHHQYRFASSIYRFCALFGWLELYRRDLAAIGVHSLDGDGPLESCLGNIRDAISGGAINQHRLAEDWRDCVIRREELQAIGHRMMAQGADLDLVDFGSFFDILRSDPDGRGDGRWFIQAAGLFDMLGRRQDFRLVRMKMLVIFLTDLMELLQPGRIDRRHIRTALDYLGTMDGLAGGPGWRSGDGRVADVETRLLGSVGVA